MRNQSTYTVRGARDNLGEILNQVHYGGKIVIVTKHGRPCNMIMSYADGTTVVKATKLAESLGMDFATLVGCIRNLSSDPSNPLGVRPPRPGPLATPSGS